MKTSDCICGEFIASFLIFNFHARLIESQLVIDKALAALPKRSTDNAIIIQSQDNDSGPARVFKLNAVPEDPILLARCVGYAADG